QLQTAIQVSNAAIAITDPQDLIQQAVDLIKKHFNFYYVGLFLADDQNQWAILKAGTGQAGKKQLAAKHRLKLDGDSMIGWSISNRQARITGDVRQDTVHYTNPYLPETQSEMALPLVSRNETLGAISVQSAQENAFSEEDINVLQSVADQIAIALQNSQFLSRIQTIQARFEGLYHRAPTGYHTTSADGFILEINDTELAMLGREGQRQEIINHLRFGDFLADESKAQYQTALKRLLEKGQKVENLELLSLHQNGYYFPILMTAAPELDETGQVKEIYASVQDISRQKEIEAARESLLEETETLYNLSQELMAAKSREDIYQVSINAIKTTSPSRGIAILMYDRSPVEITLNLAALWHNPRQTWPPVSLGATFSAADLDLPGGILLSGDTVVSLDGPADERFTETLHQLLSYMQIRSMVAAPIWSRDMVIGFVLVGHSASIPFTKTDIRLIKGVAQQMSISIDNLGLLQETLQRAAQLEIAAEVAKNTTTEVNLDALLSKVVDLLEDSLGYYHTAIFLVDEYQQYAVVEAAAGRGEETLFTQKYKLSLNISSQVGSVIETGKAKITPDIAKTLNYLEHPLLSDTRSELTLPLIVHGKVIGALDVQSDKPNDFQLGEDIVLQTIADQLANAIYVARLFARELAAAQEIQNLHKHYLQDEWETFLDAAENEERTSFVILPDDVSGQEKQAIAEINTWISRSIASAEEAKSSVQRTLPATDDNSRPQSALISPLILRDTPLGALGLIDQDDRQWTEDDLAIIEAISAQAALAIENARLIEETQRWALEQQQVAEKLRAVDKLKTQFLANMSHELRTPLNSIIGFSRVILKGIDGPLTELQKTDLSSIYQSGKHLLDLINNILDLAKIEAGKVDLNFVPVDLNSLLKGLASTAAGLVKDKEIKIIDHIVESLPVIEGDDVRIRQIFLNLISNSAKFTEKGSITLSASYTQTHVSVSISDTGIGISPQNREYIFDEFTQVDASTTRQAGGTGLGLPITQKFVELHHGQIIVESEAHRGATFTVVLPIRQPNSGRDQDNSPSLIEQSAESQPPPTLLVIDGDARVADIYRQYLQDKKFNFVSLNKGSGAAARANELQPYAILLDVLIPDADGWSILGELKENPGTAHIPVIICSIVDDKFRANQLGAAEYLLKPIIKNDLLQAIERLEEHKKNFKQVLVIDDNAEDILLIKRILRAHECQIIEALNGLDGLDIIYRNPPSLIVLDLTMPDLDGFGVLESLRDKQKTKNIPVIVITARELDNDELEIVNRQANALLLKGKYTDVELLQYVNKFLGDNS
ncbi:MAG TPA: GAF domain-containing protein, partial [Chloroflexi bacterium]|nr:GAF domain-containing protein [Chloroflexota bacterium]